MIKMILSILREVEVKSLIELSITQSDEVAKNFYKVFN